MKITTDIIDITASVEDDTFKAGGGVPVCIQFTDDTGSPASPGSSPVIELALFAQTSGATVLAYTDTFTAGIGTGLYTAILDTNDSRLLDYISGLSMAQVTLNVELRWTIGSGLPSIVPNFPVNVQAPLITPGSVSGSGPTYLTSAALSSIIDGSGNILIGTKAKLVPLSNGFQVYTSEDGVTFTPGESFTS